MAIIYPRCIMQMMHREVRCRTSGPRKGGEGGCGRAVGMDAPDMVTGGAGRRARVLELDLEGN